MKRIIIIGTAVALLGAAATALAAAQFNTYTTQLNLSSSKAGSSKKPVPISMHQVLTAQGTNGNRAAPLIDLKSTLYGVKFDPKAVKATCSFATVENSASDSFCLRSKKAALVATANVHALLGPAKDPSANATDPMTGKSAITACNPGLRVWNSGGGKLTFFFWNTTTPGSVHYCGGVATGQTPPYKGTIKNSGKDLVIDVPLPPYVSTNVLKSATWGSLIREDITWKKITNGSHALFASVGCKGGKRPWSQLFKATFTGPKGTGGTTQSFTAKGSLKCT